jgi:aspartate ammonia-lyase
LTVFGRRGQYALVHPNDVFPTAMRLAALQMLGYLYSTLGSLI